MAIERFNRKTLVASPWKNGGGATREIACYPPGSGINDFDWRISIADVASSGPFSQFIGIDRNITLLNGAGMHLASTDQSILHPLTNLNQPFEFSGDAKIEATLVAGACQDFNVMVRRSKFRAQVQVLNQALAKLGAESIANSQTLPLCHHGLLLALRGHWKIESGEHPLLEDEGIWWSETAKTWQVSSNDVGALLMAVSLHPQ